jgi:hypothetical protein
VSLCNPYKSASTDSDQIVVFCVDCPIVAAPGACPANSTPIETLLIQQVPKDSLRRTIVKSLDKNPALRQPPLHARFVCG